MESLIDMSPSFAFTDLFHGISRQAIVKPVLIRPQLCANERMDELNAQIRHVLARPGSGICMNIDDPDLDDSTTAEHASWPRASGRLRHPMSAIVPLKIGRHPTSLTIHGIESNSITLNRWISLRVIL